MKTYTRCHLVSTLIARQQSYKSWSKGLGLPSISIFHSQWQYEFGGGNLALLCQYVFGGDNLALLMKSHVQVVVVFGGDNLALWKPTGGATVAWMGRRLAERSKA